MKIFVGNSSFAEYFLINKTNKLRHKFLIVNSEKKAREIYNNLVAYRDYFKENIPVLFIPSEKDILDIKSQIDRNFAVLTYITHQSSISVLTKEALTTEIMDKDSLKNSILFIHSGIELNRDVFIRKLYQLGYTPVENPEYEGEFSVRGNFITVNIPKIGLIEIDLWGDFIENIFLKSKLATRKKIKSTYIFPLYQQLVKSQQPFLFEEGKKIKFRDILEGDFYFYDIHEHLSFSPEITFISIYDGGFSAPAEPSDVREIHIPVTKPLFLKEEGLYFSPQLKPEEEIDFEPLNIGDYIIHEDFGIGIFRGVEVKEIRGKVYDFMILEYAGGEKILVSYLHFDKIHKYKAEGQIKLDRPGAPTWRNLKKKVKEALKQVARQLITIYSHRKLTERPALDTENEIVKAIENSFEFVETHDQLVAINQIKEDFRKNYPMDRLICGDVGFGKTEVAIRAIGIAVSNGYQVAVLVPTTVLAFQHYKKLKNRLTQFGIRVENLSRLVSKAKQRQLIEDIKNGKVDVVVATHRILQDDVEFKNLGLLVVDEEHRFGVRAKEKLRQLKTSVDSIYISATPIPRTLNMVLSSLKDISVINSPPEGRFEVKTYISPFCEDIIKKAIGFELNRKGQVFYLHNRIETIHERLVFLKTLFPQARVDAVHGRMKPRELEDKMINFIEGNTDILVATSIIETGVDIPAANTLIVERADLFGLTQLYHIRGRVGRGDKQAYCYLLTPPQMTKDAQERIRILTKLTRPGSGLKVSVEDMKIRGPGNIFGVEQSGFIKAVGLELYLKLLKETLVEEGNGQSGNIEVEVDFDMFIPKDFITDPTERLNLYMALSNAQTSSDLDSLKRYLEEFYGGLPDVLRLFIKIKKLQKLSQQVGFSKIQIKDKELVLCFKEIEPSILLEIIKQLNPDKVSTDKLFFYFEEESLENIINGIENIIKSCKIDTQINFKRI